MFNLPESLKPDGDEEEEEKDPEYVALPSEAADVEEVEDAPITEEEVNELLNALLDIEDDDDEEDDQEVIPETIAPSPITERDPDNPLSVEWSHIQPVAILHMKPALPRYYDLVLGADNKMYILPRMVLRQLVPHLPRRKKRKEGPVINPVMRIDITGDAFDLMEEVCDNKEEYREYKIREVRLIISTSFRDRDFLHSPPVSFRKLESLPKRISAAFRSN